MSNLIAKATLLSILLSPTALFAEEIKITENSRLFIDVPAGWENISAAHPESTARMSLGKESDAREPVFITVSINPVKEGSYTDTEHLAANLMLSRLMSGNKGILDKPERVAINGVEWHRYTYEKMQPYGIHTKMEAYWLLMKDKYIELEIMTEKSNWSSNIFDEVKTIINSLTVSSGSNIIGE